MNQIISSTEPVTMSSREIAELVEARHNDVVTTIDRLFSKGLLRSSRISRREATGGRPIEVYDLIERDTHLIIAGYSDEHRARVIDRWQELEARQASRIPQSLSEALRLAADQAEQIERQQEALAIAAPKAEFVDKYVDATGLKGFRQVAKLLNANEREFRDFLADQKIMYRLGGEWVAYENHRLAGRFDVKTGTNDQSGHAFNQTKFTAKGVNWIAGLWAQHCLQKVA